MVVLESVDDYIGPSASDVRYIRVSMWLRRGPGDVAVPQCACC